MNIHTPLRLLGQVDISKLLATLPIPTDSLWEQGSFRNEELAKGPHDNTRNIIRRHEWFNRNGIPKESLDVAVKNWVDSRSHDKPPYRFNTCKQIATTTLCSVYQFSISQNIDREIDACSQEAIQTLTTPGGIILRSMITALPPGYSVSPHRDSGLTAQFAHRIHIPLAGTDDVIYRIGSNKVSMSLGNAYDFNNRWMHEVLNTSKQWRINLILDYLEDPTIKNPWSHLGWTP